MKKALIVATVLKKHIVQFHIPTINMLKNMGWQVDVAAANDYDGDYDKSFCDNYYDIPFGRSPLSKTNRTAYKQLKKLIDEGQYDVVHCHTPMGGFLTRLAAQNARKNETKVFYTAHGFHFYKGAPLMNWLLYYPAERYCSRMTDVQITINKEDYEFAKNHLCAREVKYIPGIGIDLNRFCSKPPISEHEGKVIMCTGELIKRKNHESVIRAVSKLQDKNVRVNICGDGEQKEYLQNLIDDLELNDKVELLGYRNDIPALLNQADLYIQASFQEGLPVSLMEAMATGLPCIASDVRGSRDLLKKEYLFNPNDVDAIASMIGKCLTGQLPDNGKDNEEEVKHYSQETVLSILKGIYSEQVN